MGKFKTHEEFLEDLWNKNKYYRQKEIKVLDTYVHNKTKITVLTKCGKCSVLPSTLFKDAMPTIRSAVNKTSFWKNMCLNRFGAGGNDDLSQVEYINDSTKVKIIDPEFGEYWTTPNNYYGGKRSKAKGHVNSSKTQRADQKEVFDKIRKLHPDLEILPDQEYININTSILVKNKYGICSVSINNLLKKHSPKIVTAVDKNSYFANQAREVHGDKYDYTLVEYKKMHIKVKIIGPNGVFEQTPSEHLQGSGCPIEGRKRISEFNITNPQGWNYKAWIKSGNKSKYFNSFKVYFIECTDEETGEHFYKIGNVN